MNDSRIRDLIRRGLDPLGPPEPGFRARVAEHVLDRPSRRASMAERLRPALAGAGVVISAISVVAVLLLGSGRLEVHGSLAAASQPSRPSPSATANCSPAVPASGLEPGVTYECDGFPFKSPVVLNGTGLSVVCTPPEGLAAATAKPLPPGASASSLPRSITTPKSQTVAAPPGKCDVSAIPLPTPPAGSTPKLAPPSETTKKS